MQADCRPYPERSWERVIFYIFMVIFIGYFGTRITIAIINDSFQHPQSLERIHHGK